MSRNNYDSEGNYHDDDVRGGVHDNDPSVIHYNDATRCCGDDDDAAGSDVRVAVSAADDKSALYDRLAVTYDECAANTDYEQGPRDFCARKAQECRDLAARFRSQGTATNG